MRGTSFLDRLKLQFGDKITGSNLEAIDPWIEVSPEGLVELCEYLKSQPDLRFDYLNCITVVDFIETDPKKAAKVTWQPHLEVVYHLSSVPNRNSLVLKVMLPRWHNNIEGTPPECPTVCGVWRTADWHERECYDLSGVNFTGHPNLRRILCPEDWEGYPLRRDYVQPLEYHGIRNR